MPREDTELYLLCRSYDKLNQFLTPERDHSDQGGPTLYASVGCCRDLQAWIVRGPTIACVVRQQSSLPIRFAH